MLTWWQGVVTNTGQTSSGKYIVVNQHYQTVATLHGTGGWVLTLHTMVINGNDAWVTANKNVPMNLSRWGGVYNGTLVDSAVQEYNLKTGKLLRSWDALKHISLNDSHSLPPANGFPWDAYHVNSINVLSPGHGAGLDARHLGCLQDQHRHRQDRLDARRQSLGLHVRARTRSSSTSTTCRCCRTARSRCSTTPAASWRAAAPTWRRPARPGPRCSS